MVSLCLAPTPPSVIDEGVFNAGRATHLCHSSTSVSASASESSHRLESSSEEPLKTKSWMPGSSPGMTEFEPLFSFRTPSALPPQGGGFVVVARSFNCCALVIYRLFHAILGALWYQSPPQGGGLVVVARSFNCCAVGVKVDLCLPATPKDDGLFSRNLGRSLVSVASAGRRPRRCCAQFRLRGGEGSLPH
jgi:hypothetical protein